LPKVRTFCLKAKQACGRDFAEWMNFLH
jgi:hypothetical protein